jgi:hypothetical protein
MQYTFQPQFVVQSCKNQDGVGTSVVSNQPQEISSPKEGVTRGI